jgi:organic radical activating enzyme
VITAAEESSAKLVDITGGAPEMHPFFRRFVRKLRGKGFPVLVRTNLTILLQPGFETMPFFFESKRFNFARLYLVTLKKTSMNSEGLVSLRTVYEH